MSPCCITTGSCISVCVYRVMDALAKFGEHVVRGSASSNSYTSLVLSKLSACTITQYTHAKYQPILYWDTSTKHCSHLKFHCLIRCEVLHSAELGCWRTVFIFIICVFLESCFRVTIYATKQLWRVLQTLETKIIIYD